MRTSRVARDTARMAAALAPRAVRLSNGITRPSPEQTSDDSKDADFDHSATSSAASSGTPFASPPPPASSSRKRKRGEPLVARVVKQEIHTSPRHRSSQPVAKTRKARRQPAKKVIGQNGYVKVEPPPNWQKVYALTKEMRAQRLAPVDTMGCESLAEDDRSPRDRRFQTLVALMLSSQTKDTVTAVAMKNLQQNLAGGLTLESILAVQPAALNDLISKVGFHNNKTKYIKAAAELIRDEHGSDIPATIEGLVSLPGVGPKMAYLCMSAAWGRDEGIGVDVHVHRITNLWGWHKTKEPEETRAALESWLPRDKWHDINNLLVGFGQTLCLPVGRKCDECRLAEEGLCPSAVVAKTVKVKVKKEEIVPSLGTGAADGQEEPLRVAETTIVEAVDVKPQDSPLSMDAAVPDIEDMGGRSRRSRRLHP